MHVELSPRRLVATASLPVEILVTVTNPSDVIVGYSLRVLGADPSWVTIDQPEPRLFPRESTPARILITLPPGTPAGQRQISVQVRDIARPGSLAIDDIVLEVPVAPRLALTLDPATVTGGRAAEFTATVTNEGNAPQRGRLQAVDPEAKTSFTYQPRHFHLDPGSSQPITIRAKARRKIAGDAVLRPFQVTVAAASPALIEPTPVGSAIFIQKALFSRGILALVGLLAAVTIFAVVISAALSSVVSQSAADRNLALAVAQARDSDPTSGTASISGTVLDLTTGAGVTGLSVGAFSQDDTTTALVTGVTAQSGQFSLTGLPAGSYLVRVEGAGYSPVWYPAASAAGEAQPVELGGGKAVSGLSVVVGGTPASLAGTVTGEDFAGATLSVQMPLTEGVLASAALPQDDSASQDTTASALPEGAVVATTPIGSDGTFEIKGLPSPAVYDLIVSKVGFAPTVQRADVAAGEDRTGIELALLDGDGVIQGIVTDLNNPIGGATITATSEDTTVETVSLTQDEVGSFTLRGLPTPATYTVVVTADGRSSVTMSLSLTQGQELTGVSAVLGKSTGSLGGRVSVTGGSAGGVTVTVTDGAMTVQTVTQSTSPVGRWQVSGLRIPSTYTVTFSGSGLASQVLSVKIDGFGTATQGAASASAVNATLQPAKASLSGIVRQTGTSGTVSPAGNVTLTLSSGTIQRVVTSASTPASKRGRYAIDNLPPGTYTATFTQAGTTATSTVLTLAAGQHRTYNPVLVAPARITGTILTAGGDPAAGLTVNLYRASQYGTAAGAAATTTTRSDGTYAFTEVDAPEHYLVEVRSAPGGTVLATSTPISLSASAAHTFDVSL